MDLIEVPEILVVDYGVGNLASVTNMLRKVGAQSSLSNDRDAILAARRIILPGVGAFDAGMSALLERDLPGALCDAVQRGAYLLGICLGAQLLLEGSEEGRLPGLGFVKGHARRLLPDEPALPVPQMGWNIVRPRNAATLFDPHVEEQRFYFAHSYYPQPEAAEDVAATCVYGLEFACALERERIFGAQFHPEKSHRFGMDFVKRFVNLGC